MSTTNQGGQVSGRAGTGGHRGWPFARTRSALGGLVAGLLLAGWAAGGTDRYGEPEGFFGGVRGAYRTVVKGLRYTTASVRDCGSQSPSSVRNLGLGQQIETRLCQDKRVDSEGIIVQVEDDGTAVLKGLVPDAAHKEKAVALTRDTRGVARVVDHLAVPPPPRVIDTSTADLVPTGLATHSPRTYR
jgi:hypothetical protein